MSSPVLIYVPLSTVNFVDNCKLILPTKLFAFSLGDCDGQPHSRWK